MSARGRDYHQRERCADGGEDGEKDLPARRRVGNDAELRVMPTIQSVNLASCTNVLSWVGLPFQAYPQQSDIGDVSIT